MHHDVDLADQALDQWIVKDRPRPELHRFGVRSLDQVLDVVEPAGREVVEQEDPFASRHQRIG
jgi:hypothetical protein